MKNEKREKIYLVYRGDKHAERFDTWKGAEAVARQWSESFKERVYILESTSFFEPVVEHFRV